MTSTTILSYIKMIFLMFVGFVVGASFVWNIVGSACSEGSLLRFSLWPVATCSTAINLEHSK